jgi:hypothetical protein
MRKILLLLFILSILSCGNTETKKPKRKFGKNKELVDSSKLKRDSILKDSIARIDTVKALPKVMYPEISEIILKEMLTQELKSGTIPGKYLNESFYDLFNIYNTDPRIVKFLDQAISEFIDYTVKRNRVDFKNVDDTIANIIIKTKK